MSKKRYGSYKKGPKQSAEQEHEVYERQAEAARNLRGVMSRPVSEKSVLNTSWGGLEGIAHTPTREESERWNAQHEAAVAERVAAAEAYRKDQEEHRQRYIAQEEKKREEVSPAVKRGFTRKLSPINPEINYSEDKEIRNRIAEQIRPLIEKAKKRASKILDDRKSYMVYNRRINEGRYMGPIPIEYSRYKPYFAFQDYLWKENISNAFKDNNLVITPELSGIPYNFYLSDKYGHIFSRYSDFKDQDGNNLFDNQDIENKRDELVQELMKSGSSRSDALDIAYDTIKQPYNNAMINLVRSKIKNGSMYRQNYPGLIDYDNLFFPYRENISTEDRVLKNITYERKPKTKTVYSYKTDREGNKVIAAKSVIDGYETMPVRHYVVKSVSTRPMEFKDAVEKDNLLYGIVRADDGGLPIEDVLHTPETERLKSVYGADSAYTARILNEYVRGQIFKDAPRFNNEPSHIKEIKDWFYKKVDDMSDDEFMKYIPDYRGINKKKIDIPRAKNFLKYIADNDQPTKLNVAAEGGPIDTVNNKNKTNYQDGGQINKKTQTGIRPIYYQSNPIEGGNIRQLAEGDTLKQSTSNIAYNYGSIDNNDLYYGKNTYIDNNGNEYDVPFAQPLIIQDPNAEEQDTRFIYNNNKDITNNVSARLFADSQKYLFDELPQKEESLLKLPTRENTESSTVPDEEQSSNEVTKTEQAITDSQIFKDNIESTSKSNEIPIIQQESEQLTDILENEKMDKESKNIIENRIEENDNEIKLLETEDEKSRAIVDDINNKRITESIKSDARIYSLEPYAYRANYDVMPEEYKAKMIDPDVYGNLYDAYKETPVSAEEYENYYNNLPEGLHDGKYRPEYYNILRTQFEIDELEAYSMIGENKIEDITNPIENIYRNKSNVNFDELGNDFTEYEDRMSDVSPFIPHESVTNAVISSVNTEPETIKNKDDKTFTQKPFEIHKKSDGSYSIYIPSDLIQDPSGIKQINGNLIIPNATPEELYNLQENYNMKDPDYTWIKEKDKETGQDVYSLMSSIPQVEIYPEEEEIKEQESEEQSIPNTDYSTIMPELKQEDMLDINEEVKRREQQDIIEEESQENNNYNIDEFIPIIENHVKKLDLEDKEAEEEKIRIMNNARTEEERILYTYIFSQPKEKYKKSDIIKFTLNAIKAANKKVDAEGKEIPMNTVYDALSKALKFVDKKSIESAGANDFTDNADFKELMKYTGHITGQAWCTYFYRAITGIGKDRFNSVALKFAKLNTDAKKSGIDKAKPGDMIVFDRGNGNGHIAFYLFEENGYVYSLDGNVSNSVRIVKRKKEDISNTGDAGVYDLSKMIDENLDIDISLLKVLVHSGKFRIQDSSASDR